MRHFNVDIALLVLYHPQDFYNVYALKRFFTFMFWIWSKGSYDNQDFHQSSIFRPVRYRSRLMYVVHGQQTHGHSGCLTQVRVHRLFDSNSGAQ